MQTTDTPTPPSRTRRAGLVLAGLLLLAAGLAIGFFAFGGGYGGDPRPATEAPPESSFEAERMSVEDGVERIEDEGAGRGEALRFARDASASIRFTSVAARRITIRARGDQCEGAPEAVVTVDGARVLTASVSSQSWQTYSGAATVAAGAHRVEISYANNVSNGECDRNLFVDRVTFDSTTPPAGTTSTPRPAQDAPPQAGSRVIWRGDFESGDLEQWGTAQRVADDRIQVVRSPTRQGSSAARFEVREGDNVGDGAPRAELALLNRRDACCREGDERWYRWQTMFDRSFPTDPGLFIDFVQFKKDGEGSGPVTFMVWGEQMEMRANGTHWKAPLRRGQWEDFVFHVKWSPDPTVGFVELWRNGRLELPRKYMLTMDRDAAGKAIPAYIKQGLYRSEDFTQTGVVFQDGMVAGTTARAVGGTG